MPVALFAKDVGEAPVSLYDATEEGLLAALREVVEVPRLTTADQAAEWLSEQAYPSGWFRTPTEARSRLKQDRDQAPMAAQELSEIRAEMSLSRSAFAALLGFSGTANTRHKQIWEMEHDRKPIMPERARLARSLRAMVCLERQAD